MFGKDSRIAVVGAGAIGGVVAALVSEVGYDVEIVCKYEDLAERVRTDGLHVFGAKGDHRAVMPAVADAMGLQVQDYGGKINYYKFLQG